MEEIPSKPHPTQEVPQEAAIEISDRQKPEEKGGVYTGVIIEFFREKFISTFLVLWTYLKTTGYVLAKPAILIDDEEDPGLHDHTGYCMATFTVTALVLIVFNIMGVESHDSIAKIDILAGECLEGDCEDGFGKFRQDNFTYTGEFNESLPNGVGLLKIRDSIELISKFDDGYLVGTGFAYNESLAAFDRELRDGETADESLAHFKPFLTLIYYLISLFVYIKLFGFFKGIYRDMPRSYITKAAIFHFNMMFFFFVFIIMLAAFTHETGGSGIADFVLLAFFFFHPIFFFLRLGKVERNLKGFIGIPALSFASIFFNFINVIALATIMFGYGVLDYLFQ